MDHLAAALFFLLVLAGAVIVLVLTVRSHARKVAGALLRPAGRSRITSGAAQAPARVRILSQPHAAA